MWESTGFVHDKFIPCDTVIVIDIYLTQQKEGCYSHRFLFLLLVGEVITLKVSASEESLLKLKKSRRNGSNNELFPHTQQKKCKEQPSE